MGTTCSFPNNSGSGSCFDAIPIKKDLYGISKFHKKKVIFFNWCVLIVKRCKKKVSVFNVVHFAFIHNVRVRACVRGSERENPLLVC